jgi:hypothetical protein
MESTGADHREALILEAALRWGPDNSWGGNPGTLDHLGAGEFDRQVREVVYAFAMDPAGREGIQKLAEAEHLIPPMGPTRHHRDDRGRWVRVGATAEVTRAEFYPMERKVGERFRIAEIEDDGGVVRRCLGMYIRHDPGTFQIVSKPTQAEERERS